MFENEEGFLRHLHDLERFERMSRMERMADLGIPMFARREMAQERMRTSKPFYSFSTAPSLVQTTPGKICFVFTSALSMFIQSKKEEEERQRKKRLAEEEARKKEEAKAQQQQSKTQGEFMLDLDGSDIDPETFAALPPEVQQEVLLQLSHTASVTQQQQEEQPQMDESFLAELPPEFRDEAIRGFQEQMAARNNRQDENAFLMGLPDSLRQEALLTANEEYLSGLSERLQEEARRLRARMEEREAVNLRPRPKEATVSLLTKDNLPGLVRVMYLEDSPDRRQMQINLIVAPFLYLMSNMPETRALLMDNLYRLLVAPPAMATVSRSVLFDPFVEPWHPAMSMTRKKGEEDSTAMTDGDTVPVKSLRQPGPPKLVVDTVLRYLNERPGAGSRANVCELLTALLQFAGREEPNTPLRIRALECAYNNCATVDFSEQPVSPTLCATLCALMDKPCVEKETDVLMRIIKHVSKTHETRARLLRAMKSSIVALRRQASEAVHDFVDRSESVLQPVVDFVSSKATGPAPSIDCSELAMSPAVTAALSKFITLDTQICELEETDRKEAAKTGANAADEVCEMCDDDSDIWSSCNDEMDPMWNDLDRILSLLLVLKSSAPTEEAGKPTSDTSSSQVMLKLALNNILPPLLPVLRLFFIAQSSLAQQPAQPAQPAVAVAVAGLRDSGSCPDFFRSTSSGSLQLSGSSDDVEKKGSGLGLFCERYRSLLNDFVRQKPSLLEKELACLLQMPRVLEFDTKMAWFRRRLERMHADGMHGRVDLRVKRENVFMDSFNRISHLRPRELQGHLNVRFEGEQGIDAGGLTREWYHVISREMFNADYGLFRASPDGAFQPNPSSSVNPHHLMFFKFVGRVVGKALWDGEYLDAHFTRSFYKHILGQEVKLKDLESLDPDVYRSMCAMIEYDVDGLTFVAEYDEFGERRQVELKPGGADIAVTHDNKLEYIRLYVQYRLSKSIEAQVDAFLQGFHDLIPAELVAPFTDSELELLISGMPEIDIADLRAHTRYEVYTPSSPQIIWFWRVVESLSCEEKARLLQFVTGSGKVPLGGFAALSSREELRPFTIVRSNMTNSLPTSHTCFNQLDLPAYESYEKLRKMLLVALNEGYEGFGFS